MTGIDDEEGQMRLMDLRCSKHFLSLHRVQSASPLLVSVVSHPSFTPCRLSISKQVIEKVKTETRMRLQIPHWPCVNTR